MHTPFNLQNSIEKEVEKLRFSDISHAREGLTDKYRNERGGRQSYMTKHAERIAYVAARMPATYAVVKKVLEEVKLIMAPIDPKSLIDMGAGPGTVMWAALEVYPGLKSLTMMEKDVELIALAKRLSSSHEELASKQVEWKNIDLEHHQEIPTADMIVFSYSIGELSSNKAETIINASWKSASQLLVVIEPGTPAGFQRIHKIRDQLISLGGNVVAPCPHANACPLKGGDWCHFSERIERTHLHRMLKDGSLGYEDEKYSYIVVSKSACDLPSGRVLRHPLKRSGHVSLSLCTEPGIIQETISKKTPEAYKKARKLDWGDYYP